MGLKKGFVLSLLLFFYVVTELTKDDALNVMWYADDLVLKKR